MNFLVDAQLPRRLAALLQARGHDAVHTLDLPFGNATPDGEINAVSTAERRVVVTKDSDFVDTLLLHGQPWKLLLVSTGNVSNQVLLDLIEANLDVVTEALSGHRYVELSRSHVIVHF